MQTLKQIQTAVIERLPGDQFRSTTHESIQTRLYTCGACDNTDIASEMQSCPDCQAVVDEVPSGTELGDTPVSA